MHPHGKHVPVVENAPAGGGVHAQIQSLDAFAGRSQPEHMKRAIQGAYRLFARDLHADVVRLEGVAFFDCAEGRIHRQFDITTSFGWFCSKERQQSIHALGTGAEFPYRIVQDGVALERAIDTPVVFCVLRPADRSIVEPCFGVCFGHFASQPPSFRPINHRQDDANGSHVNYYNAVSDKETAMM